MSGYEWHLVIPKNTGMNEFGTTSTIKLVTFDEERSSEHPLTNVQSMDVVSFELEVTVADDFLLRVMKPPL